MVIENTYINLVTESGDYELEVRWRVHRSYERHEVGDGAVYESLVEYEVQDVLNVDLGDLYRFADDSAEGEWQLAFDDLYTRGEVQPC
jgi:hypothetical protein